MTSCGRYLGDVVEGVLLAVGPVIALAIVGMLIAWTKEEP
jgi:hypothetical protein